MKNAVSIKVEFEDKQKVMKEGIDKFIKLYPERKTCPPNHIEMYHFLITEFLTEKFIIDPKVIDFFKKFTPELFEGKKDGK